MFDFVNFTWKAVWVIRSVRCPSGPSEVHQVRQRSVCWWWHRGLGLETWILVELFILLSVFMILELTWNWLRTDSELTLTDLELTLNWLGTDKQLHTGRFEPRKEMPSARQTDALTIRPNCLKILCKHTSNPGRPFYRVGSSQCQFRVSSKSVLNQSKSVPSQFQVSSENL